MLYTFLDFELDDALFELRSRGEVIATQARVFALIQYLLQHRGRVVSREELAQTLWKGVTVSDTAISQAVMLARRALRDEGDRQQIIKTVRGRGFRFIASVAVAEALAARAQEAVERPRLEPELPSSSLFAPRTREGSALFGRTHELAQLAAALERAEHGHGALLLLGGEPGIGKTALVSEFAERAHARGADVLWGRAWEEGGAPPFWPWIQVLRALMQRTGRAVMQAALGPSRHELLPLLPELADGVPAIDGQELDGPHARFRQFDAIARLLRALCPGRTRDASVARVIIFDDLHAVDEASMQLLRFLQPELADLALLFIATYRDIELARAGVLSELVDGCAGTGQHLRLRGIEAEDATQLLTRSLGHSLSTRDQQALFALSGGNPLLLAALGHRLDASGAEGWVELSQLASWPLPERIASAVRKHLAQLPAVTRELLSMASAFGREFPLGLLARLHGCSEPELLELLEPARWRHVLRPAAAGPAHMAFGHALVCNVVYSELAPARRIELHRQIAELLEASHTPEQLPLYELAHHYDRAAADGCRDKAIEFARRAAKQAEDMTAYEVAASLYERALSHAQQAGASSVIWYELSCCAGGAFYRAGQLERAAQCFDRAAELARKDQDIERFAWALLVCSTALRGSVHHDVSRAQQLREALDLLPAGDSPLRALLTATSLIGVRSGSVAQRRAVTAEAVAMARRLGDPHVLQWTLDAQHMALWGAARAEEVLPIAIEIVELSKVTGDNELMLDGMLWRMVDASELSDVESALCHSAEYERMVEQLGSPWHRYMALGSSFYEQYCAAQLTAADELSEQVRALGLRVGESVAEGFYQVRSMFLDWHRGFAPGQALEAPPSVPEPYRVFWVLPAMACGRPDLVRRAFALLAPASDASEIGATLLDATRYQTFAVLGQLAAQLGERALVERLYQLSLPRAGQQLNLQPWIYLGPMNYFLGLMANALGERDAARQHFEAAWTETQVGPLMHAYVQFELGRLLLETSACSDAQQRGRELLMAARQVTKLQAMAPLDQQIEAALRRLDQRS